jgi:hypothetical protein
MPRILLRIGSPLLLIFFAFALPQETQAQGTCCSNGPNGPSAQDCNVGWTLPTQVAACPFGDSLQFSPAKPSRVRISVHYEDNFCNPKVGVPVDSIWLTNFTTTGTLRMNNSRTKIVADTPTDASGNTRFLLASFSGCGNITMRLYVSGKLIGIKTATVRTTDTNRDSCVTTGDLISACDLNFNGTAGDATDLGLINGHASHAAVTWTLKDSLAACPAGDSAATGQPSGRPTRLRVPIRYGGVNCLKLGVPPEAMSLTWLISTGNLRVNDKSTVVPIYADDSTRGAGFSRVTVPSFSGCGTAVVQLVVSGVIQGTRLVTVRTTDTNADGRTTNQDPATCDLDYDGTAGSSGDVQLISNHLDHWQRNALHGTLVRRTSYGEDSGFSLGAGQVFWSPSGRYISFGGNAPGACKMFYLPSDPAEGNTPVRLTLPTTPDSADYDPSWSPLNTDITFTRRDQHLYRIRPPWMGDSNTYLVSTYDDGSIPYHRGDIAGAISPNGQWVAFTRRDADGQPYEIRKIPINGDASQLMKLTDLSSGGDWYPQWSPDGQWVIFQRFSALSNHYDIYKIHADGSDNYVATRVFASDNGKIGTYEATTPGYSPDGNILLTGYGPNLEASVYTHTLDPTLSVITPIANYNNDPDHSANMNVGGFAGGLLSPRLSPDGTRLAISGEYDMWAARANMSRPPKITSVKRLTPLPEVVYPVGDTTMMVSIDVASYELYRFEVFASDPEGDAISLMPDRTTNFISWSTAERQLSVIAPPGTPWVYYVVLRVTTSSGGSDAVVAQIIVDHYGPGLAVRGLLAEAVDVRSVIVQEGPNPTRGTFRLTTPAAGIGAAVLSVFDIRGRRVAVIREMGGEELIWDGKDQTGFRVAPGVYLYRLEAGSIRKDGRVVVVR